jgi:hypothetical protein
MDQSTFIYFHVRGLTFSIKVSIATSTNSHILSDMVAQPKSISATEVARPIIKSHTPEQYHWASKKK